MEHMHHEHGDLPVAHYSLKAYLPLILVFLFVLVVTFVLSLNVYPFSVWDVMRTFMGVFFLTFGGFKVVRLKAFAVAYQEYDLLAKRSIAYAYVYPFVELVLGVSYLSADELFWTNVVTIVVMTVSAVGVYAKLRLREPIMCACLGTVFKIPMTWVTLTEDLLMASMATIMLLGSSGNL